MLLIEDAPAPVVDRAGEGPRAPAWVLPVAIAAVAFAVRLLSVMHSGGLHVLLGYDEGVYFGASTSFVSGLMPYRDFVLVHPPGSVVLLSPFALLGRLTSEPTGWAVARLAIMGLGALNAALVFVVARRVNLVAGLVAGGLYAVWAPVVHVERTTMLEAFVLSGFVVALWALRTPREVTWRLAVAGALLGVGSSAKLWGLAPLAVVAGWLLLSRAWRSALVVVSTAAVAFVAIVLPFVLIAPRRMFDLVILGQMRHGRGGTRELARLGRMFNLDVSRLDTNARLLTLAGLAALAIVAVMMVAACWRAPVARPWATLLAVQIGVLLVVPVYFEGYSSFIAPALMLVVGTATGLAWTVVGRHRSRLVARPRVLLGVAVVVVGLLSGLRAVHAPVDLRPHLASLSREVADARCVGSDTAGLLILNDVLGRNISRGCQTVVDFDGTIYAMDAGSNPDRLGSTQRRRASDEYQRAMTSYFAENDLLLIHRAGADGFAPSTRASLRSRPLLAAQAGLRVFGR